MRSAKIFDSKIDSEYDTERDEGSFTMSGNEANQLFNLLKEKFDELKSSIEKSIDEIKRTIEKDQSKRDEAVSKLHRRIDETESRITTLETTKISTMEAKIAVLAEQASAGVSIRTHLVWLVFAIAASVIGGIIGMAIKNGVN